MYGLRLQKYNPEEGMLGTFEENKLAVPKVGYATYVTPTPLLQTCRIQLPFTVSFRPGFVQQWATATRAELRGK